MLEENLRAQAENGDKNAAVHLSRLYFKAGEFEKLSRTIKPLLAEQYPPALFAQVDFLMRKDPNQGIGLLYDLAAKNVPLANHKMAMLLYFHPELTLSFQDYLKQACQLNEQPAVVAAVSLFFQCGQPEMAAALLAKHQSNELLKKLPITQSVGTLKQLTPNFSLLARPAFDSLTVNTVAKEIELLTVDNFISPFDCQWLIHRAADHLNRSQVVDGESGTSQTSGVRTKSAAQLTPNMNDWILLNTEAKIAGITHVPMTCGELSNVLHYQVGEEYKAHYDFFHPKDPGAALAKQDGSQRFKTALIYLNEIAAGGETAFPRLDKQVSPQLGRLVVFRNTDNQFNPLPHSLHQGVTVTSGEKWLLSKWLRQNDTSYKPLLVDLNL
ncbi:2OG-Fe(II) oxygenase [Thalassotalea fusca]